MARILIVEDEESFSDALSYSLRKEGYEVAVANTGDRGLAVFQVHGADLVLLDLMLPGMSGTDVCREIRKTSSVPVIMLTAKDDEFDKVLGLELGADDYVTKPYSSRELLARIKAVLRRGEQQKAPGQDSVEDEAVLTIGTWCGCVAWILRFLSRSSSFSRFCCATPIVFSRAASSSIACGAQTTWATRKLSTCTSSACARRSRSIRRARSSS